MVTLELLKLSYEQRCVNLDSAFRAKCSSLDLDADYLLKIMPESDLPYHNTKHMMNVAFDSEIIASLEEIPVMYRRKLFVSGLFHDVNHTGVAKPDSKNLKRVDSFLTQHSRDFRNKLDMYAITDIFPIIQETNTDFMYHPSSTSFLGGLLRDADLISWCYMDFDSLASALSVETGQAVSLESTRGFLSAQKFNSGFTVEAFRSAGLIS